MPSILVVDDEAYRTQAYRSELARAGFEITYCSRIDEAREALDNPDLRFHALVQDLQMGRPTPDEKETMTNSQWEEYRGLAGLWFLVKARDWLLNRATRVAILTQRPEAEYSQIVAAKLQAHGVVVRAFRKIDTPAKLFPQQLLELVNAK